MPDLSGLSSRAVVGMFYEQVEISRDLFWPFKIGMEIPSDQAQETYKWLGFTPALREWVGGRNAKGLRENGITIINKHYESTLEIALRDLRRDKTGQIEIRIAEFAQRFNQHWASLLSTLIVNGGTLLGYDGVAFYSASHVEGDSGTYKNLLTASEVGALDVTTAAAPTAAEMAQAILGVIGYMYGFKDDQGEPMNEDARNFIVHVPVNLWSPTMQAISSNLLAVSGGGNIDNPLKGMDIKVQAAVNPRFTTTTVFYVHRTDGKAKPFILQNEQEAQTKVLGEDSDHCFKTDNILVGVDTWRNVGYGYPQQSCKCTLS